MESQHVDAVTAELESEFSQALADGDLDAVQRLTTSAPQLLSGSALTIAAFWGHVGVLDYLVSRGCDLAFRGKDGYTALHEAARSCKPSVELFEILLRHGADVNAEAEGGLRITPLHVLLNGGYLDEDRRRIADRLLHHGAKINSIAEAVALGKSQIALQMVENGMPLDDFLFPSERTALHVAAILGDVAVISKLTCLGKPWLDAEDWEHKTALDLAGTEEIRQVLRLAGARTSDEVWSEINSAADQADAVIRLLSKL